MKVLFAAVLALVYLLGGPEAAFAQRYQICHAPIVTGNPGNIQGRSCGVVPDNVICVSPSMQLGCCWSSKQQACAAMRNYPQCQTRLCS